MANQYSILALAGLPAATRLRAGVDRLFGGVDVLHQETSRVTMIEGFESID